MVFQFIFTSTSPCARCQVVPSSSVAGPLLGPSSCGAWRGNAMRNAAAAAAGLGSSGPGAAGEGGKSHGNYQGDQVDINIYIYIFIYILY